MKLYFSYQELFYLFSSFWNRYFLAQLFFTEAALIGLAAGFEGFTFFFFKVVFFPMVYDFF
jgi:hypothetical protein